MSNHQHYRVGDRVRHARRGPGVVTERTVNGDGVWLCTVYFDSGEKMLVHPDYLTPEPAPDIVEHLERRSLYGMAPGDAPYREHRPEPAPEPAPASEFARHDASWEVQVVRADGITYHRKASLVRMADGQDCRDELRLMIGLCYDEIQRELAEARAAREERGDGE